MTQVSKTALQASVDTLLADNTAGAISAADVRSVLTDVKDSVTWHDEGAPLYAERDITASDSIAAADVTGNRGITSSGATNVVLTVPAGLTDAQPVLLKRLGAGTLTVAAAGGVTVNSADGLLALRAQYSGATLTPNGADSYTLIGDLG